MSKGIKTKVTFKGIKAIDKAANMSQRMKNAFIRSKEAAEQQAGQQKHNSPTDYAVDSTSRGAEYAAEKAVAESFGRFKNPRKKAAEQAKNTADVLNNKANQAQKTAQNAKRTLRQTGQTGRHMAHNVRRSSKTVGQTENAITTSAKTAKATGKYTAKLAKKSIKTAKRSGKVAIKTAEQTAKAARITAKAGIEAAKVAARAARIAIKVIAQAAKVATKAIIAAVKAAVAAIQELASIIAAGGWVAVLVIIIICVVGLLACSAFGVFFNGESSGGERSINSAITELDDEFSNNIWDIQMNNPHNILDTTSATIRWSEVLAVYSVRVADDSTEVVTFDDDKVNDLHTIMNEMVTVTYSLTTETIESGEVVTLTIISEQKSPEDMAEQYNFTESQRQQLSELLRPEYQELWDDIIAAGQWGGNG